MSGHQDPAPDRAAAAPDGTAADAAPEPAQGEHYFTAEPVGPARQRRITVPLAGSLREVSVASGIFSPDGIDRGTAVLLRKAPPPPATGDFLDLGCGWGPLALTLALLAPEARVWAVDVNERALDLLRRNAVALGADGIHAGTAASVPPDVGFDLIWSNPPIRIGKAALHELLSIWLPRLRPGGAAYLVVAKQLGADSLQGWLADTFPGHAVTRHATDKGFRVLRVTAIPRP